MAATQTIAALYVDVERGPYASIEGVEPWGVDRDARLYKGPYPVVAHPPCAGWGAYRMERFILPAVQSWQSEDFNRSGAEMICGPIAVRQVRKFGGVLEHPAHSALWPFCSLPAPGLFTDAHGGRSVEVYQSAYGHSAPKRTWLYVCGCDPSIAIRDHFVPADGRVEALWSSKRHLTPNAFADLLVSLARSVKRGSTP